MYISYIELETPFSVHVQLEIPIFLHYLGRQYFGSYE